MAAARALRSRPSHLGYPRDGIAHLLAPLTLEAEGQALDNRPRPAAPLDGPAGPLGDAAPRPKAQATRYQNSFNLAKPWQDEGENKNRSYHQGQLAETRRSRWVSSSLEKLPPKSAYRGGYV